MEVIAKPLDENEHRRMYEDVLREVIEIKGMNKLDKIGRNAKALFTCG
jgi:hypothetical protein